MLRIKGDCFIYFCYLFTCNIINFLIFLFLSKLRFSSFSPYVKWHACNTPPRSYAHENHAHEGPYNTIRRDKVQLQTPFPPPTHLQKRKLIEGGKNNPRGAPPRRRTFTWLRHTRDGPSFNRDNYMRRAALRQLYLRKAQLV